MKYYTVAAILTVILMALLFSGCRDKWETRGYFYVASTSYGYRVAVDNEDNQTAYVSQAISVEDAIALAKKLNADIPARMRPKRGDE